MTEIRLFTIGFTKKTAERFFSLLKDAGVKTVLDVRLNNSSQLAGFAKKDDLQFFLKAVCNIEYRHLPELAPTKEILDAYKASKKNWALYEARFLDLMKQRQVEQVLTPEMLSDACLLCSEHETQFCHRRLVSECLQKHHPEITVVHLV